MFGARVPEWHVQSLSNLVSMLICQDGNFAQSILWLGLFLKLGVTFTQNCGTISPFCAYCDVWCHSSRVACSIIIRLVECVGTPRHQWLPNPVCYLACFWLIGNVLGGVLLLLPLPPLLFHSCSLGYSSSNCTAGHHCWWPTACLSQGGDVCVVVAFCCCQCQVHHPEHAALCHATKIVLEAGGGAQLFKE